MNIMAVNIKSIEESLSISYVGSVVAKSGAIYDIVSKDYGVDVCVRNVDYFNGKMMDTGVVFDIQLKATIKWKLDGEYIIYDLEADTYNKLIYRHNQNTYPCILVLLCLPREQEKWVEITEEVLNLRKCCYFMYINGNNYTENSATIRIRIPRTNILTPESIEKLIFDVKTGVLK
jgi:hypothetical protein